MAPAIEFQRVWKRYRIYRERYRSLKEIVIHGRFGVWDDHWVLQDVGLGVDPGTSLGVIGANGAGKSTSLKVMARILVPDRGRVTVNGRVSSLIELGAGFQPEYSGRENVYLNGSLLGLNRGEIRRRFDQIVEFAELHEYIDQPLRTYSSGMAMRLGFAVAISVDPEILLVDEVLAVGDESFQRKCFAWFQSFQRRGGTLVLVTHNLSVVTQMCDRAVWLAGGRVRAEGLPARVVREYLDSVDEQAAARPQVTSGAPAAELISCQLLGSDGKVAHTLSYGDPLVVRLDFRVSEPLQKLVFRVRLGREDGIEVYTVTSEAQDLRLDELGREGSVRLAFTAIPLLAGAYLVTASIYAPIGQDPLVLDEMQLRFNVISVGKDSGLVRLEHSWSVQPWPSGHADATPLRGSKA